MKKSLREELERMLTITYGEKVIEEQNLLNRILSDIGLDKTEKKVDDPKKADLVSSDVQEFYDNLESIESPIFQQKYGGMEYQKDVESVQIGLILLGYELPRFGVDGLFGPETANAVNKFKTDNNIKDEEVSVNENINEVALIAPVSTQKVTSNYGEKRSYESHPGVDIAVPSGTEIKSPADGKVLDARFKAGACGGTIQIEHGNGFVSRYCHCKDIRVSIGDMVKQGDVVGLTGGAANDNGKGNSRGPHLHFELKKNGSLVDPLDYIGADAGTYDLSKEGSLKSSITPQMVGVMIGKLKEKGVTSEELSKLIDQSTNKSISIDGSWVQISKELIMKHETFSDKASWDENAYRGGYGSGKKLVNGRLETVTQNTTWTKPEAEETLDYEIKNFYGPTIAKQLGVANWNKLNDRQKASLVSLGYNAGPYYITARGYGKQIKNAIQNDDMELAASYIEKGPTTGAGSGKVYSGLEKRRKEEAQIFLA
jgi:murein DD-endopeptidase MepM/ murein hydrolase activator NlpD/GH24 family phage-related lysozyme (muramidase)